MKLGYKQTDLGIIPEDWGLYTISELCQIVSGGTPSTAIPNFWLKGNIPWCTPTDITSTAGKYIYKTDRNITSLGLAKSSANLLPEGSLLLCSRATIGEVRIAKTKIATNQGFKSLICNSINNEFMYYKVLTLKERLKQFSIGSTFLEFSKKDIAQLQIDIPNLEEQKLIASALSDIDRLIESLEQLIDKKRVIKTAAMQQLLTGKKRLPGFDSEWLEKNMAQDSYLKARIGWQGLTTAEYLETGKYILITGTDFTNGKVDWNNCCYVKKERYDQDKNIQAKLGDILLTKDGTIGKVAYIDELPKPATLNSGVYVIRPKNESYHPLYFYYVLRSKIFKDFLNKLQAGSTINHLYQKDFLHFSFTAPPVQEQKAISQILYDMDNEISLLQQRLAKAHSLKKGMMNELLTGKTRLVKKIMKRK